MKGTSAFLAAALLCVFVFVPLATSGEDSRRDLKEVLSRLPRGEVMEEYPIPAYARLVALEKGGGQWVDQKTFAGALQDLRECVDHYEQMKNGPWADRAEKLAARLKVDPAWGSHRFAVVCRPPYLVCSEAGGEAGISFGDALYRLEQAFGSLIAEPLGLTPPEGDGAGRKVYVFRDTESFTAYQKVLRQPMPPGVTGLYRPVDQWVIAVDVPKDAGARARVLHNAVHQLVHIWTKSAVERDTGEDLVWNDKRLHSRSLWFQEGLAEMLSATREEEDGRLTFMVPLTLRLKEWRAARKAERTEWTLAELLSFRSNGDMRRAVMKKGPAQAAHLSSLFYAQAWSFCWFLWNADDGKYREKFLAYAKKELHGSSGLEVFSAIWSEGESPDWATLQKEWLAHAERQMASLD